MGWYQKKLSDGTLLEYDQGKDDKWCVYVTEPGGSRNPPRDVDCFLQLKELSKKFGSDVLYADYVAVYKQVGKSVDNSVFDTIADAAVKYRTDSLKVEKLLSILYMTTISEENKKNARLGKRIKRLGIHKLLIDGVSPEEAAYSMNGMGFAELDKLCKKREF